MQCHYGLQFMWSDHITTTEETWDAIAHSFDVTRRKPWQQCLDFIDSLPKTAVVADIGCGNGRHLIPCAQQCQTVIGIDISRNLLSIVEQKLKERKITNTRLYHANVSQLPLKDESVDAVLYIAALHNVQGQGNRIQSLKEVNRILKTDGTVLISVWSRWQDKYRKQFFKKWFTQIGKNEFGDIDIYWRQHGLDIPRFYHLYSKKEFVSDIRQAGLEIVEIQDVKLHSKKHPDNYFAIAKNLDFCGVK
jgi:tRNA (uracil-5-)-methyltransferase TRM9